MNLNSFLLQVWLCFMYKVFISSKDDPRMNFMFEIQYPFVRYRMFA